MPCACRYNAIIERQQQITRAVKSNLQEVNRVGETRLIESGHEATDSAKIDIEVHRRPVMAKDMKAIDFKEEEIAAHTKDQTDVVRSGQR